ncbi:hypothetical protein FGIG_11311 [Fasciola gigantica]|uniref:Uncharacterized protein n=1 Tax=Fasciola gigantica TaxID=46835 RepID=A0A504Y6N8_FASGI|nr:hypothetical protein FGIG_11311 [Fasciola gigantica]
MNCSKQYSTSPNGINTNSAISLPNMVQDLSNLVAQSNTSMNDFLCCLLQTALLNQVHYVESLRSLWGLFSGFYMCVLAPSTISSCSDLLPSHELDARYANDKELKIESTSLSLHGYNLSSLPGERINPPVVAHLD